MRTISPLFLFSIAFHVCCLVGEAAAAEPAPTGTAPDEASYTCTCEQESCGNGSMPGLRGRVYSGIAESRLERNFGPERTGLRKTGWSCTVEEGRRIPIAPEPAPAVAPTVPTETLYACRCAIPRCGNRALSGSEGDSARRVPESKVKLLYGPERGGGDATGWQCVPESRAVELLGSEAAEAAAPAARPAPRRPVRPVTIYSCSCHRESCGGDGMAAGTLGQLDSGISEERMERYAPERTGEGATGWVCTPPRPRYTCVCAQRTCGGGDSPDGEQGQRTSGILPGRVRRFLGTDGQATGWSCSPEAAPVSTSATTDETEAQAQAKSKAGIGLLDIQAGGALGAYNATHMGALALKPGVAVTADRNGYIIFPIAAQLLKGAYVVSLGAGFQYDVRVARNLYLTPRASLGYAALIVSAPAPVGTATAHAGHFTPEMGIKYIIGGRTNLGLDLFSLPIVFASGGASVYYRLLASLGFNF